MKKVEITNNKEINDLLKNIRVCNLAMVDIGRPYVVPMNFGYKDEIFYFHGAPFGRKIEVLKTNPDVCVSFFCDEKLNIRTESVACSYSMKYKSILAFGTVVFVDDIIEKKRIMNIIMKHYTDRDDFDYNLPAITNVSIFYLKPDTIKAFRRGY